MTKDEALKLALEALEEAADAIDSWGSYASGYFQVKHDLEGDISKAKSAITAIKEALAQPEQICGLDVVLDESMPPNTFKLAQPEPVIDKSAAVRIATSLGWEPKRTWVGLTQEDIDIAFDDTQEGGGFWEFAQAIEAKLKEKNT